MFQYAIGFRQRRSWRRPIIQNKGALIEFRQELCPQHVRAVTFFVQVHQQIKMKIDQSLRVKPVNSFFDFYFRGGHRALGAIRRRNQGTDGGIVVAWSRLAR